MKWVLIVLAVGAVVSGGVWYVMDMNTQTARGGELQEDARQARESAPAAKASPSASGGDDNIVEFVCRDSKKITAVFTRDIVGLTLSDGRQIELRQEIAASGIRYLSANGSIEFHGKGTMGYLEEDGVTTFEDCDAQ